MSIDSLPRRSIGAPKVGVMGGTFDPIHNGHLLVAQEAFRALELDGVIFVPTGNSYHKKDHRVTSTEDRYMMTFLATLDNPDFSVSRLEIDRGGPSHTAETLREMRHWFDSQNVEFFFITGIDAVMTMDQWSEVEELPKLCKIVAVNRPGYDFEHYNFENLSATVRRSVIPLEIPLLSISSTDLRRRASHGQTIRYLVPHAVEQYIDKRGLYRESSVKSEV